MRAPTITNTMRGDGVSIISICDDLRIDGDLNLGLNLLLLTDGIKGCCLAGHNVTADKLRILKMDKSQYGNLSVGGIDATQDISLSATKKVDGVDISDSDFSNIYTVKSDSANVVMHTGDTLETTLKSFTVPANTMGINGAIRILAKGYSSGNNGNKTYRLKFGGITIAAFTQAADPASQNWTLKAAIHNDGAANDQCSGYIIFDEATIDYNESSIGSGVDTTVNQVLEITVQLVNAADEARIHQFTVEINPTS